MIHYENPELMESMLKFRQASDCEDIKKIL